MSESQVKDSVPQSTKKTKWVLLERYLMAVSALTAVGLTAITYALLFGISFLMQKFPIPTIKFITIVFIDRGWIPYLEVYCFWAAIMALLLKLPLISREFKAFGLKIFPDDLGTHYGVAMGRRILANIHLLPPDKHNLKLVNRVNKTIGRLVNTSDTSQMDDVLRTIGEVDRDVVDSSYTMVRYIIWLIPTLGFLGTLLGISLAIAEFPNLIIAASSASGMEAIKSGLTEICKQLGVAFDTTLLALVMSAIIAYVMGLVRNKEEGLLTAIDEYCIENIISRVVSIDAGSNVILEGIKEGVKEMRLAIDEHGQVFQEKMDDLRMRTGSGEVEKLLERLVVKTGEPVPTMAGPALPWPSEMKTSLTQLFRAMEESQSEMLRREKILMEKIEHLLSAGHHVSHIISEMKEFQNFAGLVERQAKALGDIQKTLSLQLETMEKTNIALRDAVSLRDQIEEMKSVFSKTREMISQHLETVGRQQEILDKALSAHRNLATLQGVLEKNDKTMGTVALVLERMAKVEEKILSFLEQAKPQADKTQPEAPDSPEGEIFLPDS